MISLGKNPAAYLHLLLETNFAVKLDLRGCIQTARAVPDLSMRNLSMYHVHQLYQGSFHCKISPYLGTSQAQSRPATANCRHYY